jgi:hypothetical protein
VCPIPPERLPHEEALENTRDAIAGYIAALEQDGHPVPEETFTTTTTTITTTIVVVV